MPYGYCLIVDYNWCAQYTLRRFRIVDVPGFVQYARGILFLDDTPFGSIVFVLGDRVCSIVDFDETIPGIIRCCVTACRITWLWHGGHVAGFIVNRGHPAWAGRFGDVGDFIDIIRSSRLIQIPSAVTVGVF